MATPTDAESGWLRVSTPYSGDGKGQLFTPEKGSQVLVGYEQGQAERPVVLGNHFSRLPREAGAAFSPDWCGLTARGRGGTWLVAAVTS